MKRSKTIASEPIKTSVTVEVDFRYPVCFVCRKEVRNVLIKTNDQSGVTVVHPGCARPLERNLSIAIIRRLLQEIEGP